MSKYQLVINSDDPNEISTLLAALSSGTAMTAVQTAPLSVGGTVPGPTGAGTVTHNDDDENSDAPADANGVDKNGLPWDDRIHSTPAKLTNKGVWRKRKGVEDGTVAQVEAELRNRSAAPAPQQMQQPAPVQTMPQQQPQPQFPQPGQFDPNAQQQQPVYQQPQQPAPQFPQPGQFQQMPVQSQPVYQQPQQPAPVVNAVPPQGLDFNSFMQKIQSLLATPSQNGGMMLDAQYLQTIAQRVGVPSITDVGANPQLLQRAVNLMASEGRWA